MFYAVAGVVRLSKKLFGDQPTQAMANEKYRPLPDATELHGIEHFKRAIWQRHAVTRIAFLRRKPTKNSCPFADTCRVLNRPHANIRKLFSKPIRPRLRVILVVAPSLERIPAQAMNEHDVRFARIVMATGNFVQCAQTVVSPELRQY